MLYTHSNTKRTGQFNQVNDIFCLFVCNAILNLYGCLFDRRSASCIKYYKKMYLGAKTLNLLML